jgi:tRNA threonylcarbamoyladenosine biosynthesis protein TsaB
MLLALETSGAEASVAVGEPGSVVVEERITGLRKHASGLFPAIRRVLAAGGVRLDELDGLVIADGPGSFTGLRIAAAAAKAVVHGRDLPLLSASALLVTAAAAGHDERRPILAATDALRGEYYFAVYRFDDAAVHVVHPPSLGPEAAAAAALPAGGLAVAALPPDTLESLARAAAAPVLGPPASLPGAGALLNLGRWPNGHTCVHDPATWEPVYGRAAEAQVRWEAAHGRALPDPSGQLR